MKYLIIFAVTILCCLIFDRISLVQLVKKLIASYGLQLTTMKDAGLTDEEKQRVLLKQVASQLGYLVKLVFFIFLFISPFILYVLLEGYSPWLDSALLYSFLGIVVSCLAVLAYILIKKLNGKLFKERKNAS